MSVSLVINGTTFAYPSQDDKNKWGTSATAWAQAVTTGMLQKAGGTFQLLAEVDFGTAFGIKALSYKSRTANVSSTGIVRLAKTDAISWRNNANSADLALSIDGSNQLLFNGVSLQPLASVTDTSTIDLTLAAGVLSGVIVVGSITNSLINASAAIAYSKLNVSNSIVNADVNTSAAIALSKLADGYNLSVIGRSANSSGAHADINGTNNQVLRISSSNLGFGAIDLATAQVTGVLPIANQASQTLAGDATGTTAAATVIKLQNKAVSNASPANGDVLTWNSSTTQWEPNITGSGPPTGGAGGALAGLYPNPTLASQAADTFLGNATGSPAVGVATTFATIDSATIIYDATSHTFQAAATTGDVTSSQNSNAMTIANSAVTNAKMANMVTDTFKGNVSGSTAAPSDVTLSSLASTSLIFTAHTFVRAALTGAITSSQNSNATAFGTIAAKSLLANATNATAVPAALAGTGSRQYYRVTGDNTGLEVSTFADGVKTTAQTVSAATTVLATTGSLVVSANKLSVGSRFRVSFTYQFNRGATATALNLNSFLDINVGVTGISTVNAAKTAAGNYNMRVEGEFTVLSTGAGGTCMASITTWGTADAGTVPVITDASNSALALDTTGSITIRGAAQMNTNVSNTSIVCTGGHVEWLN